MKTEDNKGNGKVNCQNCLNYRIKLIPLAFCRLGQLQTDKGDLKLYNFEKLPIKNGNFTLECKQYEGDEWEIYRQHNQHN
jgi:hypothetical protein